MMYEDRIYGMQEITEPVILELIACPTLQRLKDIDQAGYRNAYFPDSSHSRFEHSVGVYLLLKQYGAPLEEQIAGLIHDVSHSAFSHCIDYVLKEGNVEQQSHQDNVFDAFVRKSEIPDILKKYGLDLDYILDDAHFPLKEKDLPDLCADRIDYSMRTIVCFKEMDNVRYFLDRLIARGGKWFFADEESARRYAELFLKINNDYYCGIASAVMFQTVADYLKEALKKKYITEGDLYTTDKIVLAKIAPHHKDDPELARFFDRMDGGIGYKSDPENYEAEVLCKSRVIDPLFEQEGELKRVSDVNPAWKDVLREGSKPKKHFIRFDR